MLRPGGTVAIVTWQGPKPSYPPRDVFSETLLEFGLRASDRDQGSHNGEGLLSASAAGCRAGAGRFFVVRAAAEPLGYRFEPHSFLEWKEYLDERQVFQGLDRRRRDRLVTRVRSRLSQLRPHDFVVPDPVVYVTGRRR